MTDSELFNSDSNLTEKESNENSITTKYDSWDKEALIKKALNADQHIATVEAENANYKNSQKTDETLKEVLKALETRPQEFVPSEVNQASQQSNPSENLSKKDVETMVSTLVEEKERKLQAKTNVNYIKSKLKEIWGEDYKSKVSSRVTELGIPQQYLEGLAESHPDAFLKIVLPSSPSSPSSFSPPSSTVSVKDNVFKGETYKEFRAQEKANPNLLYDGKFQRRKFEMAKKLGDDFYK